jgi:hypothetical protein
MLTEKPNETSHGHPSVMARAIGIQRFDRLESMERKPVSRQISAVTTSRCRVSRIVDFAGSTVRAHSAGGGAICPRVRAILRDQLWLSGTGRHWRCPDSHLDHSLSYFADIGSRLA